MFKIGDNVYVPGCKYTEFGVAYTPIMIKITSFFNEYEIVGMKEDGTEDIYSVNMLCNDFNSAMEHINHEASFYEMECEIRRN